MFIQFSFSGLDKHNRMTGLNIEKDRIELWEESKDGSGKKNPRSFKLSVQSLIIRKSDELAVNQD